MAHPLIGRKVISKGDGWSEKGDEGAIVWVDSDGDSIKVVWPHKNNTTLYHNLRDMWIQDVGDPNLAYKIRRGT